MNTITFTHIDDDGYETDYEIPAKYEVCSGCQGHGTRLHRAIGEHAYSAEEFQEEFDAEEQAEYFRRGGRYDVTCDVCHGQRVEQLVDEAACFTEDHKQALKVYHERAREEAEYQATCRAERRMGA